MIDRMLFQDQFEKVLQTVGMTPILIGWAPVNGGVNLFRHWFKTEKQMNLDKKHWDWTYPYWLLRDMYSVLEGMNHYGSWWKKLAELRFKLLFEEARFKFPDGTIVVQPSPGIMKSGCYLTILLNSLGQLGLHFHVMNRLEAEYENVPKEHWPIFVLGDDTTQESWGEWDVLYQNCVKDYGFSIECTHTKHPEFCGFHLLNHDYMPAYRDKHAFLLEHLTLDPEVATSTLMSYQLLYYNDPLVMEIIRVVAKDRGLQSAILPLGRLLEIVDG
jgi:hypothetical protein